MNKIYLWQSKYFIAMVVGSIIFLLIIVNVHAQEFTYTETTDCKLPSRREPVYDKEGNIIGYIVVSPCEEK